ncbi:hypothetical protein Ancab_026055 [Ancistrocladus abbreviatus]
MSRSGMSPPVIEDDVECSFAMEYHGPPLNYDIPRVLPINVEKIPVASMVVQASFSDKMSLPVVQPVLAPENLSKKFSKELKKLGSDTNVSPTSVIDFERTKDGCDCGLKEAELASVASLSPSSVIGLEERGKSTQFCAVMGECSSSGTLEFSNAFHRSGDLSGVIDSSAELGCSSIGQEYSNELLDRAGSSCTLEYCESFGKSQELSGVLCSENLAVDDLNPPDWASTKSVSSMDFLPSTASSFRDGDYNSFPNGEVKRAPIVTFRDMDSNDDAEDLTYCESETIKVKKESAVKVKKGVCYHCFKGSRFTEKEVCLVCNAKYCSNCILRAMGSMPEGRKCVACIGCPIDESKRGNLGKCSRMLKRLLNDLEIQQIMQAEKSCDVNQLPAEYICVNGKPLCQEELIVLQSCPNQPKNLKPGKYWYDKVSGLWGKEGQKPYQIITPYLSVGDSIKPDASNGNTQVFINGREITKVELRFLQLAGVQCAGNPHFWVNEDGSYQEEGQKNTKGYVWGKAGAKLLCALLSLPVPSKAKQPYGKQVNHVLSRSVHDYLGERMLEKLLLVGHNGSGTSTIFKQAKILYKATPFDADEKDKIKLMIQGNVYAYLGILLEGRERFEEESLAFLRASQSSDEIDQQVGCVDTKGSRTIYSICPRLKEFSDWLLKTMASGDLETVFPAASREYAPVVEELWNNAAIQATYSRRSELETLPGITSYFLERAVDVLRADYEPSDLDILYAEGVTSSNGLACVEFSFPQSAQDDTINTSDQLDSLIRYQLIRVQARGLAENCKWLEMLEDVRLVIFCVALSDYDQLYIDENGASTNKMMLSKKFFESIVTHPTFEHTDFLLLLNKFDLFEEKIEQVPLTQCEWFDDFHPLISRHHTNSSSRSNNNTSLAQLAFHYIAVKFKRLYSCLSGRKLFVSLVKGLDADSVDEALKYAREILKWDEERINFSLSDYSIYSTEASSFSP